MAFVLLFESGVINKSTAILSMNTHQYLANAVGTSAGEQPTELNIQTAELTAQEDSLSQREAVLRERELAVNSAEGNTGNERTTYILASILLILLVLIVLNYGLDYIRNRERQVLHTS